MNIRHPDCIYRLALALALAILAFGPSAVANAQPQGLNPDEKCIPRAAVLTALADKYGESTAAIGLSTAGNAIEVTVSDKGTWTVIVTTPEGCSSVVSAGVGWEFAPRGLQS